MGYLWLFLSGLFAFNTLPHLIHGISGERFFLPSRQRHVKGAPTMNVLWGFINLLIAVLVWNFVFDWPGEFLCEILTILAGGLLVAITLSLSFAKRAEAAETEKAKEKK